MTEWLGPDNLHDPENKSQDVLNELANESGEIAGQVEFWPVGVEVGHLMNLGQFNFVFQKTLTSEHSAKKETQ